MIPEPFNRLNDAYFKYIMASPERKHITIAFLNAVLNHMRIEGEKPKVIEDIAFLDREAIPEQEKAKGVRFDILARSKDGRRFHIELQNIKEPFFFKRSFFYAAYDYVAQLERGQQYDALEPVIFIGIMNFTLIGTKKNPEDWYSLHRLVNVKTQKADFLDIEFHMIELPLLRYYLSENNSKPEDALEEFLCYFGNIGDERFLEEISGRNINIQEIRTFERLYRSDSVIISNYFFNERAKTDMKFTLEYERREGREEGRAEGLAEAQKEAAKNLRSQGILTDEQIAEALNMPVETVKAL